jgi:hypothetical protein
LIGKCKELIFSVIVPFGFVIPDHLGCHSLTKKQQPQTGGL